MKPTFHHWQVNGIFEDPAVYLRLFWERRSLLFDAGDIWRLNARQINTISDVFITHTHIDHFIGFDRILRVMLRRERPLRIYGPEGITGSIDGRLRGYMWNLIEDYPAQLIVHEVRNDSVVITEFSARLGFKRRNVATLHNTHTLISEPHFSVKTAILDHGVPVLAFSVEEGFHINVDKALLSKKGLPVGPWLSTLKDAIRKRREDEVISVNGRGYPLMELQGFVRITEGQKVSYVVDISPTGGNISKAVELIRGSHTLYIETYFLDEDRDRAIERKHLTARIAGEIARNAGVREIIPLHLSPKYRSCPERVLEEAISAFKG